MDPVGEVATLARRLGIAFDHPRELGSTNNLVLWLQPSDVVAKAGRDVTAAARELLAGALLAERGAPVVRPAAGLEPVVHTVGEWAVTFWRHVPAAPRPTSWSDDVGVELEALHGHLSQLNGRLDVAGEPADVVTVLGSLDDPRFARPLADQDRCLLREVLDDGRPLLQGHDRVVHGSPHPGNVLVDAGRPRFIDLATICRAPVEWDLAHPPAAVASGFRPSHDPGLLERCRILVSAVTAAWCWDGLDRGSDMGRHAAHHLEIVRTACGG